MTLFRKRIGRNHLKTCIRISIETAVGCVQNKVIQGFCLPEQSMQVGVRVELLRPLERWNADTSKPPY